MGEQANVEAPARSSGGEPGAEGSPDPLQELADEARLRTISRRLIADTDVSVLYAEIVEAAVALARSDAGSMQVLDHERGALHLLAWQGFDPQSARFWQWVDAGSATPCGDALQSRERVIVSDVEAFEDYAGTDDLAEFRRSQLRAVQSTPLVSRDDRLLGMVSTHWRRPHEPSERELRLMDVLARQAADLIERTQTRKALQESEARYRTLFDSIDQGFCIVEVLFDEDGTARDYRFLEMNPAFERQTGLIDALGKSMRQLAPDHEAHWFEIYGAVARTGEPTRFENPAKALGRFYDVYAFRVGSPDERRVAILFNEISERKRKETRLAVLGEISESLSSLASESEIIQVVGASLGEHLHVSGCVLDDADHSEGASVDPACWIASGIPSVGEDPVTALTAATREAVSEREALVVSDTQADERTNSAALSAAGVGAFVCIPFHGRNESMRVFCVYDARPRDWRDDEIELLHEVSNRIFPQLERAHAAAALRASEERLRLALDSAGMGSFLWYPEEDRGEPDTRMLALFGLPADSELTLAEALANLIHPADRNRYGEAVARAIDPAGVGALDEEIRVVHPDGAERWLTLAARVSFAGEPRRAVRMAGVAMDVTDRKLADAVVRASERRQSFLLRLGDALRRLGDPVEVQGEATRLLADHLDADRCYYVEADVEPGHYVVRRDYVRGGESLTGSYPIENWPLISEAFASGEPIVIPDTATTELATDEERAGFQALSVGALACVSLVKHGRFVAALAVSQMAPRTWTGEEVALVSEVAERTWAAVERARAEHALRESEERLRRALEIETVGAIFLDVEGPILYANDAFLRMSGYSREDLEQGRLRWDTLTPPEWMPASRRAFAELERTGRLRPYEKTYIRKDGSRWPALFAGTRLGTGEVFEFVLDLSDRYAAEAAAKHERVRREELEREFVANAAHELRTPLTAIIAGIEALEAGAKDVPADRDRFFAHVKREGERLGRLADSLLLLAQSDSRGELPRESIPLLEALEEIASDLPRIDGVSISVQAPDGLCVETNRGLLERVLKNVADNAAQHTPSGRIELRAYEAPTAVVIEVHNTGTGIDPATAERAFDRFYRGLDRSPGGFGLGLSIARQAAAAIGADLSLERSPKGGTVARISLGRAAVPSASRGPAGEAPLPAATGHSDRSM